jgi:prolyl 4-hydroxylase
MAVAGCEPPPTNQETTKTKKKTWGVHELSSLIGVFVLAAAYLWARSPELASSACNAAFPSPSIRILSLDPFVAHITDFISSDERAYLKALGTPLLAPSTTLDDAGNQVTISGRTSSSAFLPLADACVERIANRAAEFQGYMRLEDMSIQLTAYQPGQEYKHHYDWFSYPPGTSSKNTFSTFFAILHATCEDCGTEFSFINTTARPYYDKRWCNVIDCDKPVLTTRNVEGSAIFWVNLDAEGKGREDTLHSGLPAKGGEKVALNIWTDCEVNEIWDRGLLGGSLKPPVVGTGKVQEI